MALVDRSDGLRVGAKKGTATRGNSRFGQPKSEDPTEVIAFYFAPPRASVTDRLSEQVVCPDTRPPRSPALAAPPQRARWLCCAVGATATPHLRREDLHAN